MASCSYHVTVISVRILIDRNHCQNGAQRDLNHLDRNLDALVQELATRCRRIFDHAAHAVSRSSVVSGRDLVLTQAADARHSAIIRGSIRERNTIHEVSI